MDNMKAWLCVRSPLKSTLAAEREEKKKCLRAELSPLSAENYTHPDSEMTPSW